MQSFNMLAFVSLRVLRATAFGEKLTHTLHLEQLETNISPVINFKQFNYCSYSQCNQIEHLKLLKELIKISGSPAAIKIDI